MNEHPIEGLMLTAMNSIRDMIDVNTIIGDAIETKNNITIIPISKVTFGFAAGGSEFKGEAIDEYNKREKEEEIQYRLPFGGGSGAGVRIVPVAFLVIQSNNVRLIPVDHSSAIDKLLDYVPDLFEKTNNIINRTMSDKKQERKEERNLNKNKNKNKNKAQKIENNYEVEINKIQPENENTYEEDEF